MHNKTLRKLNILKYSVVVYIILMGLVLYWLFSRSFLNVTVAPVGATVTIDNAPINLNAQGKASKIISFGTHVIKAEADGYSGKAIEKKFWPGMTGSIKIELKESPSPTTVATTASYLYPGKNNNEILYLSNNGRTLYKTILTPGENNNPVAETTAITDSKLSGIEGIIWSPERDLALFRKNDGVYLFDFQKYDFVHQTETLWAKNIGDVAWAPDNSKIAYFNSPEKTLIFTDTGNRNPNRIINLGNYGISNPLLRWSSDSQWLLVIPRNQNHSQNKIYLLNAFTRTLNEITDTGNQLDAAFSPDNQKIVYTTLSTDQSGANSFTTSIMDLNGSSKKALSIKPKTNDIVFGKDNKTMLVALFDPITNHDSVYPYDIESKDLGASILSAGGTVATIFPCDSGKNDSQFLAYQADGTIYAVNISNN